MALFQTGPVETANVIRAQEPVADMSVSQAIRGVAGLASPLLESYGQYKAEEAQAQADATTADFIKRGLDIQMGIEQGAIKPSAARMQMLKLSKEAAGALSADSLNQFNTQLGKVSSGFATLNERALSEKQTNEADTWLVNNGFKRSGEPMSEELVAQYQDAKSEEYNIKTTMSALSLEKAQDEQQTRINQRELKKRLESLSFAHNRMARGAISRAVQSFSEGSDAMKIAEDLKLMKQSQINVLSKYGDMAAGERGFVTDMFDQAINFVSGSTSKQFYDNQVGLLNSRAEFDVFNTLTPTQQMNYVVGKQLGMDVGNTADVIAAAEIAAGTAQGKMVDVSGGAASLYFKDQRGLYKQAKDGLLTPQQQDAMVVQLGGAVRSAGKTVLDLKDSQALLEHLSADDTLEVLQKVPAADRRAYRERINEVYASEVEGIILNGFNSIKMPQMESAVSNVQTGGLLGINPTQVVEETPTTIRDVADVTIASDGSVVFTLKEGNRVEPLKKREFNQWASKSGLVLTRLNKSLAHLNGNKDYNTTFKAAFGDMLN